MGRESRPRRDPGTELEPCRDLNREWARTRMRWINRLADGLAECLWTSSSRTFAAPLSLSHSHPRAGLNPAVASVRAEKMRQTKELERFPILSDRKAFLQLSMRCSSLAQDDVIGRHRFLQRPKSEGLISHHGDLERRGEAAIKILVEAIMVARIISKEQRGRAKLSGLVAESQKFIMRGREARGNPQLLVPRVGDRSEVAVERRAQRAAPRSIRAADGRNIYARLFRTRARP